MSAGANKNYNFDSKNLWRRQMWNNIALRLHHPEEPVVMQKIECGVHVGRLFDPKKILGSKQAPRKRLKPENAVVLYLAGKDNLDLPIAISKGFKKENMIAIDDDKQVVESLRKNGQNTIHGSFFNVLENWNGNLRIDVIFADLCSGINNDALRFQNTLEEMKGVYFGTVVALNLLRGRDPMFNDEKVSLSNLGMLLNANHRGEQWLLSYYSKHFRFSIPQAEKDRIKISKMMYDYVDAYFNSYNSGKLTFDSIVFNLRFHALNFSDPAYLRENDKLKNQIATAKAIRTRRLTGTL